jgi:hypothetical protein
MSKLFSKSKFNGDISKWDVSHVVNMDYMFTHSIFNSDINNWNVSNVVNMYYIFSYSQFDGDLSNWMPYKVEHVETLFFKSQVSQIPYWLTYEDLKDRKIAIDHYVEKLQLMDKLEEKLKFSTNEKKVKL